MHLYVCKRLNMYKDERAMIYLSGQMSHIELSKDKR